MEKDEPNFSHSSKEKSTESPAVKKATRSKKVEVASGPTLIMDLSWGEMMNDHTQKKVVQQLSYSYSVNKKVGKSLPMIFTSVDVNWRQLLHRVNAFMWSKDMVRFESKPFIELKNIAKEDIIYLTADTDNVCTELDPKKYYVIGCLLDHNSKKGVTRDFAEKHNLRMERLPIPEYIKMDGRHVLTINHVAEILMKVGNGMKWDDAFVSTIPARKNPVKISESNSSQHGKKETANDETKNSEKKFSSWCNIV